MSTKVCLIVQGSFTVNNETLPCSGGYDIASTTGAHNCRNSMTGNNFTLDNLWDLARLQGVCRCLLQGFFTLFYLPGV